MKSKGRYNYKALYLDSVKQGAQKDELLSHKDHLIARQQQQLMQLSSDRLTLTGIISNQNKQLTEQADLLSALRHRDTLQQQIIGEHEQRSAQQQSIIKQQVNLITDLNAEQEKYKKQLSRMDELHHQFRMLRKMCYGIKSEKRHQPTAQEVIKAGTQLLLPMEVDSWGSTFWRCTH